jgi:hypothetical protein
MNTAVLSDTKFFIAFKDPRQDISCSISGREPYSTAKLFLNSEIISSSGTEGKLELKKRDDCNLCYNWTSYVNICQRSDLDMIQWILTSLYTWDRKKNFKCRECQNIGLIGTSIETLLVGANNWQ